MDTKLATYRSQKRRKKMIESAKNELKKFLLWNRFVRPEETSNADEAEVGFSGVNVKIVLFIWLC